MPTSSLAKAPQRRAKQRWPFVKKRTYRNGTIGWQVDSRTKSGGERKTFGTLIEAETFAHRCRVKRENEGVGAFEDDELAAFGKTTRDAVTFYLNHLRRVERSVFVGQAVEAFLEARRADSKSSRYLSDLRVRLAKFEQSFGARSIATITASEIDVWLRAMPVGALTRNTFRLRVSALFAFAKRRGWVTDSPVAEVEKGKVGRKRVQILTPAQVVRLLKAASQETLPFWCIAFFAGLRPDSEIGRPGKGDDYRLDWADLDFDQNQIFASEEGKTGHRPVPMSENLIEWLKPFAGRTGKVCPPNYHKKLREDKRRAGFGTPGNETAEERAEKVELVRWVEDVSRHSYGSYKLAECEDVGKVATWMGNSVAVVKRDYWKRVKPREAAAFWSITPSSSG